MQLLKKVLFLHDKFLKDTKRLSETDSNFSLQSTKLTYFSRCFWLYDRFEKCLFVDTTLPVFVGLC